MEVIIVYWSDNNRGTNDLSKEDYIKLSTDAVCFGKLVKRNHRKKTYLHHRGYDFPIHVALWNFFHPEDPVDNPSLITFRDGKRDNLERENLIRVKVTHTQEPLSEYDSEYLTFCKEAIQYGKQSMSKGRRYLYYKGKSIAMARALWNMWHPDDPVKITEVVHHRDGNRLNDSYENLQKLEAGLHMKLHVEQRREKRKKAKHI